MALPTKVVEQLGRAPARTPGWSGRVLMFSGTFFILSAAILGGIKLGYTPFLNSQITNLDREIKKFDDQVSPQQQEELISFYSQLVNLKTILGNEKKSSRVFEWLEDNTNINVQLTNLSFDQNTQTLTVSGQARSITSLGEQLNRFRAQSVLKSTQLTNLSLDQKTGLWTFSMALGLRPEFFKSAEVPDLPPPEELPPAEVPATQPTNSSSTTSTTVKTP